MQDMAGGDIVSYARLFRTWAAAHALTWTMMEGQEISKLRHLQFLRLSHNILSLLPGTMGKLKSLTYLNLVHSYVPLRLLCHAQHLTRVCTWQAGNRVSHFPDEMSALVNLKTLDIRRNEFKTLPDSLEVSCLSVYLLLAKCWTNYTNLTKLAGKTLMATAFGICGAKIIILRRRPGVCGGDATIYG
eukprot:3081082-Rhodomonas_salina.6